MKNSFIKLLKAFVILLILASSCALFYVWYTTPTQKAKRILHSHQMDDWKSFETFTTELNNELQNLVDEKLDPFIDDLQGLVMLWNLVTFRKNEYIEKLWIKHFSNDIEIILKGRFEVLFYDIVEHQNQAIEDIDSTFNLDFYPSLESSLMDEFSSIFADRVNQTANIAIGSEVIAISAGVAAGILTGNLLKTNWITVLVGIAVEEIVEYIASKAIKAAYKDDVKTALVQSVEMLMQGYENHTGCLTIIDAHIQNYHRKQEKHILGAFEERLNNASMKRDIHQNTRFRSAGTGSC